MGRTSFERVVVSLKMLICWLKSSKSQQMMLFTVPESEPGRLWKCCQWLHQALWFGFPVESLKCFSKATNTWIFSGADPQQLPGELTGSCCCQAPLDRSCCCQAPLDRELLGGTQEAQGGSCHMDLCQKGPSSGPWVLSKGGISQLDWRAGRAGFCPRCKGFPTDGCRSRHDSCSSGLLLPVHQLRSFCSSLEPWIWWL